MIGITLVEDLVVVVLTILMPVLVSLTPHHLLGVALALGKAALILVPDRISGGVPGAARAGADCALQEQGAVPAGAAGDLPGHGGADRSGRVCRWRWERLPPG